MTTNPPPLSRWLRRSGSQKPHIYRVAGTCLWACERPAAWFIWYGTSPAAFKTITARQ